MHAAASAAAAAVPYDEVDGYEAAAYVLASISGQLNNLLLGLQARLDKDRREIREQRAWLQGEFLQQAETRRYEEIRQQAEAALEATVTSTTTGKLLRNQPQEEKLKENPAGTFLLNLVKTGSASSGDAAGASIVPAAIDISAGRQGAWEALPKPPPGLAEDSAGPPQAFDLLRKALGGNQAPAGLDASWGQTSLDVVRQLIVGTWKGNRGDTYEVENTGATSWTCTRVDARGIKEFVMHWHEEWQGILWGSYYLTVRDLQNSPGQVVWYGTTDDMGKGPRFLWTRVGP